MSEQKYAIIFDSNTLYKGYDKQADYTQFKFPGNFDIILRKIEELDIYSYFVVGIPSIVWCELKEQICTSHEKHKRELQTTLKRIKFPFVDYGGLGFDYDYKKYIEQKINEYKEGLSGRAVRVFDLPLPTEQCFGSIICRALEKLEPFEGVDSKSDKGFKDALLWESILEYKTDNPEQHIILFTTDKRFGTHCIQEYFERFGDDIEIIKNTTEGCLINRLEDIAKLLLDIDQMPPRRDVQSVSLDEWLNSGIFVEQYRDYGDPMVSVDGNLRFSDCSILDYTIMAENEHEVAAQVRISTSYTVADAEDLVHESLMMLNVKKDGGTYSIADMCPMSEV